MSKSQASKLNYSARRDLRLRRDKAATSVFAVLMGEVIRRSGSGAGSPDKSVEDITVAARWAVLAADALVAELDRTRPDLQGEVPGRESA